MRATTSRPAPAPGRPAARVLALALSLALSPALAACAATPSAPRPPPPPAPAPDLKPAYAMADAGWRKPAEAEPGCVERKVLPPPGLQRLPAVTVKFAVALDGTIDRFEDVTSPPAAPPVVAEVRRALIKCDFVPARDPGGKPAYAWMILEVGPTRPR